jgi:hypothetical protein
VVLYNDKAISDSHFTGSLITVRVRAESAAVPALKIIEKTVADELKVKPILSIDHYMDVHLLYFDKHDKQKILGVICLDNCVLRSGETLEEIKTPEMKALLAEENAKISKEYGANTTLESVVSFMTRGPFIEISGDPRVIRRVESDLLKGSMPILKDGITIPADLEPMLHKSTLFRMYDLIARFEWAPKKDITNVVDQLVAATK